MNKRKIEQAAVNVMTDKGVAFTVHNTGLLRRFIKGVNLSIKPSKLGTLLRLSGLYLEAEISEERLNENPIKASHEITHKNIKNYALIAAIAIINNRVGIALFSRVLAKYLLWRLTTKELLTLVGLVIEANNVLDFMNTIKLTSGIARIATPRNLSPVDQEG